MKLGITPFKTNIGKTIITQLGKSNALLPILLLETTVDTGRAIQAKKRGGVTEMRERLTDDVVSGAFWLFGVKICNKIGDAFGKHVLKLENPVFSTGQDKARNALQQGFLANPKNSQKMLAAFKFSKVILSLVVAIGFIGGVLPKVNQAITRKLHDKKQNNKNLSKQNNEVMKNTKKLFDSFEKYTKKKVSSTPSFGMSLETLGRLAHNLENNAACRCACTDTGIIVGRAKNARNADEGLEYVVRDGISTYFYLLATDHVVGLFNKFDKFKGNNTKLDPTSAVYVNNHFAKAIGDKKLSVEEFEKTIFGSLDTKKYDLVKDALKDTKNITVEKFCELTGADEALKLKAKQMSLLQPKINGVSILTDTQVKDVLTDGAITNPRFLRKTISQYFSEVEFLSLFKKKKKIVSNLNDKLGYISANSLDGFRDNISGYAKSIIAMAKEQAEKKGGMPEISLDTIRKASKRNTTRHSAYLSTGIIISAAFLSTFIPKFQYWLTKKRTGQDGFPGVKDLDKKSN